MDLRQIRYFLALYEEGSITRAARRLNVVQPAVSMQIRRLEDDYGVDLFTRTGQGLEPTAFATRLYELCCRVEADVEQVEAHLSQVKGRLSGSLAIGVPPSLAQSLLAEILAAYHGRYPDVALEVHEGYSASLAEWLGSGQIELAVMTARDPNQTIETRPVLTEELVLVSGPGLGVELGAETPAHDLADLPLVLPTLRNTLRSFIETELKRSGVTVTPALEVDSLATVLGLVESGGWATIVPRLTVAGGAASRNLRISRIVEPALARELVVAHKRSRVPTPPAEAFVELLRQRLSRLGSPSGSHPPGTPAAVPSA